MGKTAFQVSDDPICPNVMPEAVKMSTNAKRSSEKTAGV
ncbi:hypothetical protein MCC93_00790 [Morococcus cerebrosus]|uniref:Uncharacterized protein n=1 Tax=Morococcus cerebrosus TaxID=1056807 RepID=A0A0C1EVI7_9NEIS|nr:hypothetical protein MCC93_00790 [Morococcus cerebrosus]